MEVKLFPLETAIKILRVSSKNNNSLCMSICVEIKTDVSKCDEHKTIDQDHNPLASDEI